MKKRITLFLIFSILISTVAPATKSHAVEEKSSNSLSISNNESTVKVTNDGIFINDEFYTQEEFIKLLDNAVPISENNKNGVATRSATAATLVAGTWWIPGVGEVVVTAAGAVIFAGTVVAAGSWIYEAVVNWFENREYNNAKENGTKTKNHSSETGSSLPPKGDPNSSKDLIDNKGIKQRRYYDENGKADLDIDYRHGGAKHKFPHRHKWSDTGRGKAY